MINQKRQKILIVGPAFPYRGGPPVYVGYLYEALSAFFDVEIINFKLLYPDFLFPGTTQYDRSKESAKQVPSRRLINSVNPWSWLQAARAIRAADADLVVFDWYQPFFGPCHFVISALIKRQYGRRILFITENVISHEARFVDRMLTRLGLFNAGAFMALAQKVEDQLRSYAGNRPIYRSELPIFDVFAQRNFDRAEERDRLGLPAAGSVLLFFGYVREYKGLDDLLRAMPAVLQQAPSTTLLIAGEFYQKPERYERLIATLGLEAKVKIVNRFIANEDVGRYFAACDMMVLPYKSATQSGILTVAYSFDRPVVATDVGGLAQFVKQGQTGLVVEPNSPAALAEGILNLLTLIDQQDFSASIRDYIRNAAFNNVSELFKDILRTLPAR